MPTGGQVAAGAATINQVGNTMNINQSTQRAVINWQSFNVGKDATVNFNQPNSNASTLNRVNSATQSMINGAVNANGHVIFVNPNGVIFGKGAEINTGGITATTMNISDRDYMDGKGNYSGNGTGRVINKGRITINSVDGYIALMAPEVKNEGVLIATMSGNNAIALVSGEKVTLTFSGSQLINVNVDASAVKSLIDNKRLIKTDGGQIIIAANSASDLRASIINNTGTISATGMDKSGGKVVLTGGTINQSSIIAADGVQSAPLAAANVAAGSAVNASAAPKTTSTPVGGQVNLVGNVINLGGQSQTTAIGVAGGGQVVIGAKAESVSNGQKLAAKDAQSASMASIVNIAAGALIDVSAQKTGNGGMISIWSLLKTTVGGVLNSLGGAISGNGGFIETSSVGQVVLDSSLKINASAASGKAGRWLLDPISLTIDSVGANVISNALSTTNVTLDVTGAACPGYGSCTNSTQGQLTFLLGADIYSANALTSLSIIANDGIINVNNNITAGNVYMVAQAINMNGSINTNGGENSQIYLVGAAINILGSIRSNGRSNNSGNANKSLDANLVTARRNNGINGGLNSDANTYETNGGNIWIFATGNIAIGSNSAIVANGINGGNITIASREGAVNVNGIIDAVGKGNGGIGGKIIVSGKTHTDLIGALISADGLTRGGLVSIGLTNANGRGSILTPPAMAPPSTASPAFITSFNQVFSNGFTVISLAVNLDSTRISASANASSAAPQASSSPQYGGTVHILGDAIVLTGTTQIQATGTNGGGTILVGGDWQNSNGVYQATKVSMFSGVSIDASATQNGNGGKVVLWSDIRNSSSYTTVKGSIKSNGGTDGGNGGQIETSGYHLIVDGGFVSAEAPRGRAGNWLLDPYDYTLNSFSFGTTNVTIDTVGNSSCPSGISGCSSSGTVGNININGTVTGAGGNLTLIAAGGVQGSGNISMTRGTLTIEQAGNTTYSGVISGEVAFVKRGLGTLTLSRANTYSGTTLVSGGTLMITGSINTSSAEIAENATLKYYTSSSAATVIVSHALTGAGSLVISGSNKPSCVACSYYAYTGVSTGFTGNISTEGVRLVLSQTVGSGSILPRINVGSNSQLYVSSGTVANPVTVNSAGWTEWSGNLGAIRLEGGSTLSGAITLGGDTNVNVHGPSTGTISGNISGNYRLIVTSTYLGGGVTTLSGNNTNSITEVSSGTLFVTGSLANTSSIVQTGTGIFRVGANISVSSISGNISIDANRTLTLVNNSDVTYSGVLTGAGNFTKSGSGILTLSAINAYTGITTISAGILKLGVSDPFSGAGSKIIVSSGATLDLNGGSIDNAVDVQGIGFTPAATLAVPRPLPIGALMSSSSTGSVSGVVTIVGDIFIGGSITISGKVLAGNNQIGLIGAGNYSFANADNEIATIAAYNIASTSLSDRGVGSIILVSKSNMALGSITINGVTYEGITSVGNVVLKTAGSFTIPTNKSIISTTGGIAITTSRFVNNQGATGLSANTNWTVLSTNTNPFSGSVSDVVGGLAFDYKQYNVTSANWAGNSPTGPHDGNGLLYSFAPTINVRLGTSANAITKVYDGNTTSPTLVRDHYSYSAMGVDGDKSLVINIATSGTYNDANVLGAKTIAVSGITYASGLSSNDKPVYGYVIADSSGTIPAVAGTLTGEANITPKAITVSGVVANNRAYDGTRDATVNAGGAVFNGLISGQKIALTPSAALFADANAGNNKGVTYTSAYAYSDGALAGNYTITDAVLTANITPKAITVSGVVANNRAYDGTRDATVNAGGAVFNGLISGQKIALTPSAALFADANAGNNKGVTYTSAYAYSDGALAGNYTITDAVLTANITPKAITVSGVVANNRAYDGTRDATVNAGGAVFNGLISGQKIALTPSAALFADANAGNNKGVTYTSAYAYSDGALAGNYTITDAVLTANITPATLSLSGLNGVNKVYDGTVNLPASSAGYGSLTGRIYGIDNVFIKGRPIYDSADAGSRSILLGSVALAGINAANYTLAWTNGSGAIAKAVLTITANDDSKRYGRPDAVGYNGVSYSGFVNGETAAKVLSQRPLIKRSNRGVNELGRYMGVLEVDLLSAANYVINRVAGNYAILQADQYPTIADNTSNPRGSLSEAVTKAPDGVNAINAGVMASTYMTLRGNFELRSIPQSGTNTLPDISGVQSSAPEVGYTDGARAVKQETGVPRDLTRKNAGRPRFDNVMKVSIPKSRAKSFAFDLPEAFSGRSDATNAAPTATQLNGSALPKWIRFDAENLRFIGTPPPGELNLKIEVTNGDKKIIVEIN
nr:YDG domain-containing protein [Polynucleobacter sp. es-MAR-4]